MMRSFRILVVEDFEPFRRSVGMALQHRAEFQIIDEVSDGLQALEKAKLLQPDLILLDIGLPKLNGLEVARLVPSLAPHAKILFLSVESSSAMVRETFRLGGKGYVDKVQAQSDLLPAIDAVLAGKKFVSNSIEFNETTDTDRCHEVQFYSGDEVFLEYLTPFIATALKANNAAIVLATKSHRESLVQRLKEQTIDIDGAIRQASYISLDAGDTLSRIMVTGRPDLARFFEGLNSLIESATGAAKTEHPRVAIFGECVGLLCAEGNMDAAIQLEKSGNELIKRHSNIDILCAYPLGCFQDDDRSSAFRSICAEHTAVHSR